MEEQNIKLTKLTKCAGCGAKGVTGKVGALELFCADPSRLSDSVTAVIVPDGHEDLLRSMLILMHSAGSRDAHLADVTYNAEPVPHLPSDFLHSEAIAACAKPAVGHAIEQIRLRWHRLSQHLPDEYPVASLAPPAPSSWSPDKADPYEKPFSSLST